MKNLCLPAGIMVLIALACVFFMYTDPLSHYNGIIPGRDRTLPGTIACSSKTSPEDIAAALVKEGMTTMIDKLRLPILLLLILGEIALLLAAVLWLSLTFSNFG